MRMNIYIIFITALLVLLVTTSASKKDHYRFRNDMPTEDEDTSDEDQEHHQEHHNSHHNRHPHESFNSIIPISRCRHNYNDRTESGVNRQINFFMHAEYVYKSMAHYFGRCDIALPGFQKFFKQLAQEQRERTESLLNYQNLRGGQVNLQQITSPTTQEWGTGLDAMSQALELEKSINQELLELHMIAMQFEDIHAANFIQTTFLGPQVEKIFTISQYITSLERVGPGLGEYMFDKLPQN